MSKALHNKSLLPTAYVAVAPSAVAEFKRYVGDVWDAKDEIILIKHESY